MYPRPKAVPFKNGVTVQDLARDPQRVVMAATIHDNLAAAIRLAEQSEEMRPINDRTDPLVNAEHRKALGAYDVASTYEHPPTARMRSVGPGAFTMPDPSIVSHGYDQDVWRRDASAALQVTQPMRAALPPRQPAPTGVAPCRACNRVRCACFDQATHAHAVPPHAHAMPPHAHAVPPHAHAVPPHAHAVPPHAPAYPSHLTRPEDDESTHLMQSSATVGNTHTIAASTAAAHNVGIARSFRHRGMSTRATRSQVPSAAEWSVYGMPAPPPPMPSVVGGAVHGAHGSAVHGAHGSAVHGAHGSAVHGAMRGALPSGAPTSIPSYDMPVKTPAALSPPNQFGLHRMPGAIDSTRMMMIRDARAQGIQDPFAPLTAAQCAPMTDALGFRFPDRHQMDYTTPKFYPARDPIDKLVFQSAAETAPDMAADILDFTVLRDMNMVEPLSVRYGLMKDVAAEMTHAHDPYMVPRTGPSVVNPGRMAEPPAWYKYNRRHEK